MENEKYKLTRKQFMFFNENQRKFVEQQGETVIMECIKNDTMGDLINRQFEFLCDEMFNSDDKEIKIDMSRALMFKGWQEIIKLIVEAQMMPLKQMGEFDDFQSFKEKVLSGHN